MTEGNEEVDTSEELDDEGDEEDESVDSSDTSGNEVVEEAAKEDPLDEGDTPKPVAAPTGRDLVDLLTADPEAQKILDTRFENAVKELRKNQTTQAEAKEFQTLIDEGNYAEVGKRLVARQNEQSARETVTDEILSEVFTPVYERLLAQPEMKKLTAEDRERLDMNKFSSDADYVVAIQDFIHEKRSAAVIKAEVDRQVKEALDSSKNQEVAGTVAKPGMSASPASTEGASGAHRTSSERLHDGFMKAFGPLMDD